MTEPAKLADVLVVDDTIENLRLLSRLLANAGFRARPVKSGADALAAAASKRPDIVLLDIDMPELDGYETCRRLKRLPDMADVPVIFLSALHQTADRLEAFAAGGVDFVAKPFQFVEVKARLAAHLELAGLRRTLAERSRSLAESLDRLREVEQLRHDLVHMAAHDMRSPLMAVGGYLELLADLFPAEGDGAEYATRAREAVSTVLRLIDAMLDVSRLEARQMPLEPRDHVVSALLDRALLCLGPLTAGRVEASSRDDLARFSVRCDAELVGRVLGNLVANALKHTDEGTSVRISAFAIDERIVRIVVADDGPGIPAELRPRLFEKFAAGAARRGRGASSGLGLAFCRLAIEAHGGRIGYDDAEPPATGARFWLELERGGTRAE